MILTVEYDDADTVEIHCDQEGLSFLIGRLVLLRDRGGHEHLMTPSWSGWELTEEVQGKNNRLINQLIVGVQSDGHTSACGE